MLLPWKIFYTIQASSIFHHARAQSARQQALVGGLHGHGAVVTESDICSKIGADMLDAGGSAADAIVAASLCVGVIAPYNSGIGGGGFATIRRPNGTYEVVNFREQAPAAVAEDTFTKSPNSSIWGGLASGVPGQVRGLQYLHDNYGKLPWKAVVEPAASLAQDGWIVNEDTVQNMGWGLDFAHIPNFLTEVPNWAIDFAPNGTLLGLGDRMTRKRLGATLSRIADEGPDVFYTGAIATTMVAALAAKNGVMTLEDVSRYSIDVKPAINITYREYNIYSCGAPCSGPIVLNTLKTLEGYDDLFAEGMQELSYHRVAEAIKFGYARRTKLGDPDFVDGVSQFVDSILTKETGAETRARLADDKIYPVSHYNPDGLKIATDHGTSHMVAADNSGLGISLTTTVYLSFGSQLMVPETGIIMNNNMDGFSIPNTNNSFGFTPSSQNYPAPGKRPMTSMAPCIVELGNGSFVHLIGAEGGSRIPSAIVQNIMNVLDRGLGAQEALRQPRLHTQLLPDVVEFEYPFENKTVEFLKGLGHNVVWTEPVLTAAQGIIQLSDATYQVAAEPRQARAKGYVAHGGERRGTNWLIDTVRSFLPLRQSAESFEREL